MFFVTLSLSDPIVFYRKLIHNKEDIKMKRSIFIALAVAAALSCTACGQVEVGKADEPIVPAIASNTQAAETTAAASEITETSDDNSGESAEATTAEAVAAETVTTAEAVAAGGEAAEPATAQQAQTTQVQPQDTQPRRPAGTAPSPEDADYAPAPVQYSREGLTYIQGALVANKSYSLPSDFNPGLDSTCYDQFCKLSNAAAQEGLSIWLASGFRSYDYQDQIYNNYVARDGQALADTYSARAGHSEHQTGLAIDVNSIDDSFAGTPEAIWLENHCHEYGFILRYPKGKESKTGYQYESWHIRYLGTDLAYAVHDSGLTLEEYFGIDSYYH